MSIGSVLWISVAGRNVASSRVRAYQLSDELSRQGVASEVVVGSGIRGRVAVLRRVLRRHDVVVVQKILFGRTFLALLKLRSNALIWECDDALHIGYPEATDDVVKRWKKLIAVALARVDGVTTSNPLLSEELAPVTGTSGWFAGPAPPLSAQHAVREPVVLWLGSPSTSQHLDILGDLPKRLAERGWKSVAVGATERHREQGWIVERWSATTSDRWLSVATIGVMPQSASTWDDRKAGYKVLQYAAAGVIPLASDVFPTRVLLAETLSDLIVSDGDSWERRVDQIAADSGRWSATVRDLATRHAVEACVGRWFEIVESSSRRNSPR